MIKSCDKSKHENKTKKNFQYNQQSNESLLPK